MNSKEQLSYLFRLKAYMENMGHTPTFEEALTIAKEEYLDAVEKDVINKPNGIPYVQGDRTGGVSEDTN